MYRFFLTIVTVCILGSAINGAETSKGAGKPVAKVPTQAEILLTLLTRVNRLHEESLLLTDVGEVEIHLSKCEKVMRSLMPLTKKLKVDRKATGREIDVFAKFQHDELKRLWKWKVEWMENNKAQFPAPVEEVLVAFHKGFAKLQKNTFDVNTLVSQFYDLKAVAKNVRVLEKEDVELPRIFKKYDSVFNSLAK